MPVKGNCLRPPLPLLLSRPRLRAYPPPAFGPRGVAAGWKPPECERSPIRGRAAPIASGNAASKAGAWGLSSHAQAVRLDITRLMDAHDAYAAAVVLTGGHGHVSQDIPQTITCRTSAYRGLHASGISLAYP